jgi:hypothetical protein
MRVGAADAVITPSPGISLAGFGARRDPARGVHDDLHARAMVFEDHGHRVGLVVCDVCEVDAAFVAAVRQRVEARAGIPPEALIVAATHTHAAPATFPLYSQPPDPAWLAALVEHAAGAVTGACDNLSAADLTIALGRESTVARNRRRADGPVDPTVTVLRAVRWEAPAACFLHYACHPTVLGPDNLLISRDYVGFAVDALARAAGGWVMFANGACADVNVGHSADRSALGLSIPGRTFERAEALGSRLAAEALRALADAAPVLGRDVGRRRVLAAGRRVLDVPLRPTPPPDEARRIAASWRDKVLALEHAGADVEAQNAARLELMYADLALQWAEARGEATAEPAEIQGLAIGDVALVALPGEFFAESGLRLKAYSPFPYTIPVGYAGGIGYVPPASAFAEGGYETRLAPWSRVAPEAEALILAAAGDLLSALRRQQDEAPL